MFERTSIILILITVAFATLATAREKTWTLSTADTKMTLAIREVNAPQCF